MSALLAYAEQQLPRPAARGEGKAGAVQSWARLVIEFIPVLSRSTRRQRSGGPSCPPLAKGGPGGVAAGTSDIVNWFPVLTQWGYQARRIKSAFENPVFHCAEITPPGPPLRKGGKGIGRSQGGDVVPKPRSATK